MANKYRKAGATKDHLDSKNSTKSMRPNLL